MRQSTIVKENNDFSLVQSKTIYYLKKYSLYTYRNYELIINKHKNNQYKNEYELENSILSLNPLNKNRYYYTIILSFFFVVVTSVFYFPFNYSSFFYIFILASLILLFLNSKSILSLNFLSILLILITSICCLIFNNDIFVIVMCIIIGILGCCELVLGLLEIKRNKILSSKNLKYYLKINNLGYSNLEGLQNDLTNSNFNKFNQKKRSYYYTYSIILIFMAFSSYLLLYLNNLNLLEIFYINILLVIFTLTTYSRRNISDIIISFILFLLSIQLFILIFLGYDTGEIYQEKILEPFFIINFVTYYRDTNICINNDYSFLFGPYVILSVILIITIFKTISFFKHNFNHKP